MTILLDVLLLATVVVIQGLVNVSHHVLMTIPAQTPVGMDLLITMEPNQIAPVKLVLAIAVMMVKQVLAVALLTETLITVVVRQ